MAATKGGKRKNMGSTASGLELPVVNSYNEWDALEEVIVGTVYGAVYPERGPILEAHGEPDWLWYVQGELMDEEYVDAADEQLSEFIHILEAEGVRVRRPDPIPHNLPFSTPYWHCKAGWNTANPRDLFLIVGNEIIECASALRPRYHESLAYHRLFTEYFKAGAKWSAAPKATLRDHFYDYTCVAKPTNGEGSGSKTLASDETHHYPITELEPTFEAADFVRCGRDLFVTQSLVTNQLGIEWVHRHLGDSFRVHKIETRCAVPWHIDTTFLPLAPGKALVNPEWVTELPACLKKWDILWAPRPTYAPKSPMDDAYFTSQWLSMNVFSIDEERLFVDEQQDELIRRLEDWGFKPIPLAFDYVGMFGGSFHCVTLDVRRRGTLESYF